MGHGTRYAATPTRGIGRNRLAASVGVNDLKLSEKGALLAEKPASSQGRQDLVAPPPGRDLRRQGVRVGRASLQELCHIVCERVLRLGIVREARLQEIVADAAAVDENVKDPKPRDRPLRGHDLAGVRERAGKPARAVRRAEAVANRIREHRGRRHGYPFAPAA